MVSDEDHPSGDLSQGAPSMRREGLFWMGTLPAGAVLLGKNKFLIRAASFAFAYPPRWGRSGSCRNWH